MSNFNIKEVLVAHKKWIQDEDGGRRANLHDANLHDANLHDANLHDANLHDANLRRANLWNCNGNRNQIKSLFISEDYAITYTSEFLQIGCERHRINGWWGYDNRRIIEMDGKKALKFWAEWKDFIKMIIEKSPAKPIGKEEKPESTDES